MRVMQRQRDTAEAAVWLRAEHLCSLPRVHTTFYAAVLESTSAPVTRLV